MVDIIKDARGQGSSVRVVTLVMVLVVLFVWAVISLRQNAMQHIDIESIMMILGALGATVTQKGIELHGKKAAKKE